MKKIILLVAAVLPVASLLARSNMDIPGGVEPIDLIKKEVSDINSMELHRAVLDCCSWTTRYSESINEWRTSLYFDTDGNLRKSCREYSYPEGRGRYYNYFNTEGVAIYSTFGCASGHDGDYSIGVFRDSTGKWLWLDFLEHFGDGLPELIADIVKNGRYIWEELSELPEMKPHYYGFYMDRYELWKDWILVYSRISPNDPPTFYTVVRFGEPETGQGTSVIYNRVPVHEKPSESSPVVGRLRISNTFTVTGSKGDWLKIKRTDYYYDGALGESVALETEGYIKKEFVEPMQKEFGVIPAPADALAGFFRDSSNEDLD